MSDLAAQWNADHSIGTPVILTLGAGHEHRGETRSVAFTPKHLNEPVIFVTGVAGYFLLSRVRPDPNVNQADGATR